MLLFVFMSFRNILCFLPSYQFRTLYSNKFTIISIRLLHIQLLNILVICHRIIFEQEMNRLYELVSVFNRQKWTGIKLEALTTTILKNKILLRFFIKFLSRKRKCVRWIHAMGWVNEENAFPCCSLGDK